MYYAKLKMLLYKCTNCTTNNYTKLQTKLWCTCNIHKPNKIAHNADTLMYIAPYKMHMKLPDLY